MYDITQTCCRSYWIKANDGAGFSHSSSSREQLYYFCPTVTWSMPSGDTVQSIVLLHVNVIRLCPDRLSYNTHSVSYKKLQAARQNYLICCRTPDPTSWTNTHTHTEFLVFVRKNLDAKDSNKLDWKKNEKNHLIQTNSTLFQLIWSSQNWELDRD